MTAHGLIAATTYAAGEQVNLLAGLRLGRLAIAAAPGDTRLVLERTLGMDAQGTVVVDNVTYSYGSLIDGALADLRVTTPQGSFSGVQRAHAKNALVTDAGRNFSGLDLARRGLFVDTALGADLSHLGRILGVLRSPALTDDDQYRRIIKAIAYNPRTTFFGLRTALDALVGAGNYALHEDPDKAPATVFVTLLGDGLLRKLAQGAAYLNAQVPVSLAGGSFPIAGHVVSVGAVHLAPSDFWANVGDAYPGAAKNPGPQDAGKPLFVFSGSQASVQPYALGPSAQAQRLTGLGFFSHAAPLPDGTAVDAGVQAVVPDVQDVSATDPRRFGLRVRVGSRIVGFGVTQLASGRIGLGLADMRDAAHAGDAGTYLAGPAADVAPGELFEAHIKISEQGRVALTLGGATVQTASLAQAGLPGDASGTDTGFDVGGFAKTSAKAALRRAGLSAQSILDYGAGGSLAIDADGATLTPATAPPFSDAAYTAAVQTLFSGQVFAPGSINNGYLGAGPPPRYVAWPFYISDPSFFVESYVSGMVAAGVSLKVAAGTGEAS